MAGKKAPLTFEEYQEKARTTAIYPEIGKEFVYPAFGLAGETGEVMETIKKIFRDSKGKINEETREKLKKELGDVLWYLSNLATELGFSLEEIAQGNLKKLASRKKRGVLHGSGDDR
jgi:NTP pyrophosphatase (non-canonical NTP hydrolase)